MDYLLEIPVEPHQAVTINVESVLTQIKEIVNNGSLGNFTVDKNYTVCVRDRDTGDCVVPASVISHTPQSSFAFSTIDDGISSTMFSGSITPSVTQTHYFSSSIIPQVQKIEVQSSLKINQEFTEDLANKSSAEFKELEKDFCDGVSILFAASVLLFFTIYLKLVFLHMIIIIKKPNITVVYSIEPER